MRLEVYINEMQFDTNQDLLSKNIQQTFDFLDLMVVYDNYTGRLSLPLTKRNKEQLEIIHPIASLSTLPYENLSIKIIQDGDELIRLGTCQIVKVRKSIDIDVQDGAKGFFDQLGDQTLNDIDLSAYNDLWDEDTREAASTNTSGLVAPVIDSGQISGAIGYSDLYTYGEANIPFFYYHTIMEKIALLSGFTFSGDVFADTNRYLKMIMSIQFKYAEAWIKAKQCDAYNPNYQSISGTYGGLYDYPVFISSHNDADGFLNIAGNNYTVTSGPANDYFKIRVTLSGIVDYTDTTPASSTIDIQKNGVSVVGADLSGIFASAPFGDPKAFSTTADIYMKNGDVITWILFSNLGAGATIHNLKLDIKALNTEDEEIVQTTTFEYIYSALMPPIKCKDFIKDFMQLFGLAMRQKDGNVEFKHIKDIFEELPQDTFSKRTDRFPEITYLPNGWAQVNNFMFTINDIDAINSAFGRGQLLISNDKLEPTLDRYTSLFTASDQSVSDFLFNLARVDIFDQAGPGFTHAASYGYRLLLLRENDGQPVRFKTGVDNTDYFIGYFIDKNQDYSLDWSELLTEYYYRYSQILNNFKRIKQRFYLNPMDVYNLDTWIPQHIDGQNYIVQKLPNYIKGRDIEAELIRI